MTFRVISGAPMAAHYTEGRELAIDSIVVHHWGAPEQYAGVDDLSAMYSVANMFAGGGRRTSAHYILAAGMVMPIVRERDTAWHAGTWEMNSRSIGIECHPRASDDDLRTLVELIDKLRQFYGKLKVYAHNDIIATACPGRYGRHMRAFQLAGQGNPHEGGHTGSAGIDVDGYWGRTTTLALQRVLGTHQDGVVSSQDVYWKGSNPGLVSGWEWVASASAVGSSVIAAMQRRLGVKADGLVGPGTFRALQSYLGTPVDGVVSEGSAMVMALQKRLNEGRF